MIRFSRLVSISLVFSLALMLVSCGLRRDVYGSLWIQLAQMYGDRLAADYVQAGHHGNNHVDPSEWACVDAEVMFFDGPERLTQSDEYSVKSLIEWCHDNGIETYEYASTPNSMVFD